MRMHLQNEWYGIWINQAAGGFMKKVVMIMALLIFSAASQAQFVNMPMSAPVVPTAGKACYVTAATSEILSLLGGYQASCELDRYSNIHDGSNCTCSFHKDNFELTIHGKVYSYYN
jgi:hypothetical protein